MSVLKIGLKLLSIKYIKLLLIICSVAALQILWEQESTLKNKSKLDYKWKIGLFFGLSNTYYKIGYGRTILSY